MNQNSILFCFLLFLHLGCKKDNDYRSPHEYGTFTWVCSVADTNWSDTLAKAKQLGFQYQIIFTRPKPSDLNMPYALQFYFNDKLIQHKTVRFREFIDNSGPIRTKYHFKNDEELLIYRIELGAGSYNYEYPYRTINGVRVKNIFKFGF